MAVIRAARPSFRSDHDKIAFAVHASFLSSGFVLTATGRDALGDNVLSSPSTGIPFYSFLSWVVTLILSYFFLKKSSFFR